MRRFCYLSIIVLLTCSCVRSEVGRALSNLDDVILHIPEYHSQLVERNNAIRERYVSASGDSLKWVLADSLYHGYYSYSVDSAMHYLERMKLHVANPQQKLRTQLMDMEIRMVRMNCHDCLTEFRNLDTFALAADVQTRKAYLSTGIAMYHHVSKSELPTEQRIEIRRELQNLREKYICLDSESYNGQKTLAQYDRDNGDSQAALDRFHFMYQNESEPHRKAMAAYNIALLYKTIGMSDARMLWLARAAEYDLRSSGKDYLSLYELALMLYERERYQTANKYVEINLADAFSGNFNSRFINSGNAHVMISEAERHNSHNKLMLMSFVIGLLVLMIIGMILLLGYFSRQRKRIKNQRDMLHKANNEILTLNDNLKDVSKIKDNYVFRYMEMSIRYLDRFDEFRNHIRSVAHSRGWEEAMKELRSREDMYQEYDNFYAVFDETFLGIYPDFVEKVNELLCEKARFQIPTTRVLRTELRVLAAIRLGITESGKIASFLKCAPPTVYTYRAKLRNSALCEKDKFEDMIRQIQ